MKIIQYCKKIKEETGRLYLTGGDCSQTICISNKDGAYAQWMVITATISVNINKVMHLQQ
ncbi:hypothetical protein CCY16_00930 [Wolbachia endosymbiont of Wuchereria bancrofti]|nr:hypothetical protein CCY16_00930 [Wolbachia endosymbiont of Wuchereria bancrofti]